MLAGIRYGLIEQLCADAGIPFALRRIARDEVFGADELLLSSASKEVLPVVTLDGQHHWQRPPRPHLPDACTPAYQQARQRNAADDKESTAVTDNMTQPPTPTRSPTRARNR